MTSQRISLGDAYYAALEYATIAHAAQVRKGTTRPYIEHPIAVAELVMEDGGTETEAIAALLHDAVEDQGGRRRLDDIERSFGGRVAEIVAGCSEWIEEPHQTPADKPSWCERKTTSIEHIEAETDEAILRVTLADKVHNAGAIVADLRPQGAAMLDCFNAAPIDILWYYRRLVDAFGERGSPALHSTLTDTVREMERLIGKVVERRHVVGVDGAPGGWVAVALGDDCRARVESFENFRKLVVAFPDAEIVAVDIPIGLEPDGRTAADLAARAYLGPNRARVFMTPRREALELSTHRKALALLKALGLPGISAQAYALRTKILEVDELVARDDRVREVHPEVSFRAMNGGEDLEHRKKSPRGFAERSKLLSKNGVWVSATAFDLKRVAADDVLDAGAAAWSALRIASGMAESLPAEPLPHENRRRIAIWY